MLRPPSNPDLALEALASSLTSSTSFVAQGAFCYNGIAPRAGSDLTTTQNARSFGINNLLLVIQVRLQAD